MNINIKNSLYLDSFHLLNKGQNIHLIYTENLNLYQFSIKYFFNNQSEFFNFLSFLKMYL